MIDSKIYMNNPIAKSFDSFPFNFRISVFEIGVNPVDSFTNNLKIPYHSVHCFLI